MRNIKFLFIILTALALVGGFFIWRGFRRTEEVVLPSKSEPNLETLTNEEGDVVVIVTPKALVQDSWSFEVVLDTHSVDLDYDLRSLSFLVDQKGREYKAVLWEGDPPEGHHRKGILKFKPLSPTPAAFMLKVRNVGSVGERSFEWQLL